MADTDTVMYKAVSLQDATKWEVGLGTYVAASKTLTRTRVIASSNANAAVDFKSASAIAPQNSAGPILLQALPFVASQAAGVSYTLTNHTDAYSLNESAATAAQIANTLGTLINSLKQAGVIA
jgi:hypothetical protein